MSHRIAGIDVHKKLLVVVVVDAAGPETVLESRRFGTGHFELEQLREWLCELGVTEAVMESTAQYWRPVWMELEPHLQLHLAQNQIESLLEEGRIKLSSVIRDLLGVSGRRILRALAKGESDPAQLAELGDEHLKCGKAVLTDALTGAIQLCTARCSGRIWTASNCSTNK